jgi:hypothetical protein
MSMETGFGSGSAEAVEDQASVPMETAEPVISKARRCLNRVLGFDGMWQPVSGVDINGAACNPQCRHNCCSAERGARTYVGRPRREAPNGRRALFESRLRNQ